MHAMRYKSAPLTAAVLIFCSGTASAQDDPIAIGTEDLTSADAIGEAAAELIDAGEDKLLISNMLDMEIKGSDGDTIGTVKDFVVVTGGRLIAAIVEVDDDTRIAIPFGAVKISGSADDLGLEVPIEADEVEEIEKLEELAETVEGD